MAVRELTLRDIALLLASFALLSSILSTFLRRRRLLHNGTPLRGPPSHSILFGSRHLITTSPDPALLYEQWAEQYGPVYRIPDSLGTSRVVVTDPKALAHFHSRETFGYVHSTFGKMALDNAIGRGLLWSEGENHKRQRKALTPAFSNAAIRNVTPVFFDSAYKLKTQWDALLEASGSDDVVIEVQNWMNKISLDSIGLAGFSHPFNTLSPSLTSPSSSAIENAFSSLSNTKPTLLHIITFLLAPVFPFLTAVPTNRNKLMWKMKEVTREIGVDLLERSRKEGATGGADKSIIGMLIKAENAKTELRMTTEEVIAQMNVLLLAGYETTSISLTWALIELAKHPSIQTALRDELLAGFPSSDPTYDQLTNGGGGLRYLDAVVHEVLRLHGAVIEISRVAAEDDILPLSAPLPTSNGTTTTTVHIPKGTTLTSPLRCMNKSKSFWGEDGGVFKPERWLDGGEAGGDGRWKEIQGYRHLLTFSDGPRTCLGKAFALAEFKSVLSVLIRNYTFTFTSPPGTEVEIENVRGVFFRPRIKGEEGCGVSLRVGRVEV